MPRFSIIVPVYNAASFLGECLDSVCQQTFSDWECICVDDGSADSSGAILDEYAAKDSRFRVVRQTNSGASAARNKALELTTGEFFLFLDADDAIVSDSLESFDKALKETGSDALLCFPEDGFCDIANYRKASKGFRILADALRPVDMLAGRYPAHGYTVSKIYRTSSFRHVRFPDGVKICEDSIFWADALCVPARWSVIDKQYYAYRKHTANATATKGFRYYMGCLTAYGCLFGAMSGPMHANKSEIEAFARNYRTLHSDMVYEAFRRWPEWTHAEREALFDALIHVCHLARPAFPFGLAARIRVMGRRFRIDWISVPLANCMDRVRIAARYRVQLVVNESRGRPL